MTHRERRPECRSAKPARLASPSSFFQYRLPPVSDERPPIRLPCVFRHACLSPLCEVDYCIAHLCAVPTASSGAGVDATFSATGGPSGSAVDRLLALGLSGTPVFPEYAESEAEPAGQPGVATVGGQICLALLFSSDLWPSTARFPSAVWYSVQI